MAYNRAMTMAVNFAHHRIQRGLLEDLRAVLDPRMRGRLHGGRFGGHRRADVVVLAPPSRRSVVSSVAPQPAPTPTASAALTPAASVAPPLSASALPRCPLHGDDPCPPSSFGPGATTDMAAGPSGQHGCHWVSSRCRQSGTRHRLCCQRGAIHSPSPHRASPPTIAAHV
jgi:hypothetical protein